MKKAFFLFMMSLLSLRGTGGSVSAKAIPTAPQEGQAIKSILPADKEAAGWLRQGEPEHFEKAGLYGYIDGGAEIFFQYGFQELELARYGAAEGNADKEITLEVYRMESTADAFGIYSVKKSGDEKASVRIPWPNWTSEGQAGFVKGAFFVNLTASGTSEAEIEDFAASVAAKITGGPPAVPQMAILPRKNIVTGTERYIRGDLAAQAESPLFGEDFWGFKDTARAVSARYSTGSGRLVVVFFGRDREPLSEKVMALFREYLQEVRIVNGILEGRNEGGRFFLFKQMGRLAALMLGDREPEAGRALINEVLKAR